MLVLMATKKSQDGWREIKIGSTSPKPKTTTILTPSGPSTTLPKQTKSNTPTTNPNFRLVVSQPSPSSSILGMASPRFKELPIGSRVEVSPASFKIAHQIGKLLSTKTEGSGLGGSAIVIDYGDDHLHGDSFRVSRVGPCASRDLLSRFTRLSKTTNSWMCSIGPGSPT